MNITDVKAYIEFRNREQYRGNDQFGGWVADALSMFSNVEARTIFSYLETGDYAKVGEMIRDRLITEYGEKAKARKEAA